MAAETLSASTSDLEAGFTCLYCGELKPIKARSREHVIPNHLTRDIRWNNPILAKAVCAECNQFFGWQLDSIVMPQILSFVMAHLYDAPFLLPSVEPTQPHFVFRLHLPSHAQFHSAVVALPLKNKRKPYLMPQVTWLRQDGAWSHKSQTNLSSWFADNLTSYTDEVYVLCRDDDLDRRLDTLAGRGVTIKSVEHAIASDIMEVIIRESLERILKRCIAKFALNYLLWSAEKDLCDGRDVHLTAPWAQFVRFGKDCPELLVQPRINADVEDWSRTQFRHEISLATCTAGFTQITIRLFCYTWVVVYKWPPGCELSDAFTSHGFNFHAKRADILHEGRIRRAS